jgi:hypothetical protein
VYELKQGDCLEKLGEIESNSIDSLVTDPPAGISFMGKDWDHDKGGSKEWIAWLESVMREVLRVLKPGGHGLVWAIPRTSHWTATALENAGFEIRDVITHLFGSGFPKSLDITKQIEKGFKCQFLKDVSKLDAVILSELIRVDLIGGRIGFVVVNVPILQGEKKWNEMQIGVAVDLKDQIAISQFVTTEPISSNMILFLKRKLEGSSEGRNSVITLMELKTIIDLKIWNLLQYPNTLKNTTSLNGTSLKPASEHWILCRKPISEKTVAANVMKWGVGGINIDGCRIGIGGHHGGKIAAGKGNTYFDGKNYVSEPNKIYDKGRFPANLILDEKAGEMLDEQSIAGGIHSAGCKRKPGEAVQDNANSLFLAGNGSPNNGVRFGDSGGASRFFYCAKVSQKERGEGNNHPTVKPLKLMEYLIKLITPKGGMVLDPFMGSGSTGIASLNGDFNFIGIEKEIEYFYIAVKRING